MRWSGGREPPEILPRGECFEALARYLLSPQGPWIKR